ncbi:MAG: MAPEG family protein [Wenzhouxiangellaceae bacterium]
MTASAWALWAYILWTLVLVLWITLHRTWLTLAGRRTANSFAPDGDDVNPLYQRITRVHANCYESFPIYGGILLLAIAMSATAITDSLAYYWLAARLAQNLTHLFSTSNLAVSLRFVFMQIQAVIALYWLYLFMGLG